MSEYWKSTPKYWCKHCKTYVRDSKLERTQHEATPKHQGNLKRFLRDLHRGHEREERDKQRAKNEVERLNSVVAGSSHGTSSEPPWKRKTTSLPAPNANKEVSIVERKQQVARLAEMGVAIPEEFRREMAMAGDWQTISERPMDPAFKKEEGEDIKPEVHSIGVRKRKHPEQEDEEEVGEAIVRKGWGSRIKTHPSQGDDDLDALLGANGSFGLQKNKIDSPSRDDGKDPLISGSQKTLPSTVPTDTDTQNDGPQIKREDSDDGPPALAATPTGTANIKTEDGEDETLIAEPIMFKKRKAKNIRQR